MSESAATANDIWLRVVERIAVAIGGALVLPYMGFTLHAATVKLDTTYERTSLLVEKVDQISARIEDMKTRRVADSSAVLALTERVRDQEEATRRIEAVQQEILNILRNSREFRNAPLPPN